MSNQLVLLHHFFYYSFCYFYYWVYSCFCSYSSAFSACSQGSTTYLQNSCQIQVAFGNQDIRTSFAAKTLLWRQGVPPTLGSFFLYKVQYLSRTYLPSSSSSAYFYIFSILSAVDWSRGGADKLVLDSMDFKKSSIGCCFRPESDYPEALLVVCLYALNTDLAIGSVIFFKKLSSALLNAILVYYLNYY